MVYLKAVRVGNSPNQDPRRAAVNQVILHHTASTGDVNDIWNMFMQPNSRSVSANFLIAQNGDVYEVVNPDTGRAWTTGSGPGGTISPDHSAITMECMDSSGAPEWGQSAASCESIAQVIAWAAKRYGFTPVRGVNVRGHREMPGQSTACPGGMPMDDITARAIQIFNEGEEPDMDQNQIDALTRIDQRTSKIPGIDERLAKVEQQLQDGSPKATSVQGKLDVLLAWVGGGTQGDNKPSSVRVLVTKIAEKLGVPTK